MASTPAAVQGSGLPVENQNPILVIWAHTDLPHQGTPTLDVVDLEQYFGTRLEGSRIQNAQLSATFRIPDPVPPNIYLLDLTVDALQGADRTAWDSDSNNYHADPVFNVDLSLMVWKSFRTPLPTG